MEYQLILIVGDGNCLFPSVSYIIFCMQEKHRDIRLTVDKLVINNWVIYKKFFIGDLSYGLPYWAQMVSMLVISNLNALVDFIQIINLCVYRSNDLTEFVDYGSSAIMCNLFFLTLLT